MEQRDFILHHQTKAVCDTFIRRRGPHACALIDGNILLEELEIGFRNASRQDRVGVKYSLPPLKLRLKDKYESVLEEEKGKKWRI